MSLLLLFRGATSAPEEPAPVYPRIAVTQEFPPDTLSVIVREPNGGAIVGRWAQDEPNVENVFTGLTKSGEMPGGHKELTLSLPRDARRYFPDQDTYNDIEVQGPGGEEVWSGRLMKKPASDGGDNGQSIQIVAIGYQNLLEDAKHIGPGFIDSDLSKWGEPSTERRKKLAENNIVLAASMSAGWQGAGSELPGVIFDFAGVTSDETKVQAGEAWNDGGGVDIGEILYFFKALKAYDTSDAGHWLDSVSSATDDVLSAYEEGENHHQASNVEYQTHTQPYTGRKFGVLKSRHLTGASGNQIDAIHGWLAPKVIGRHGLALQGTWPDVGYTARQMLPILAELAGLRTTDESLEDDGFVIPQAWFSDPETLAVKLNEITKYSLLDWFVFGGRLLQYRFPGTYGRYWQASASQSGLRRTGEDGTRLWDEIMVRWRDVDGRTKTMGPPGSGAQIEDEALRITDPNHPAVRAEITRRDVLDLKSISTESISRKTAIRWLEEANQLDQSGEATFSGYLQDDCGTRRPVSQVQPGDHVRFPDSADQSYRKITAPTFNDERKVCNVTLDAPPEGLKALEERFNARLISRGLNS